MGTYWNIGNTKENRKKFKKIYDKHFKKNKDQFKDDFGNINCCRVIWDNGFVKMGVFRPNYKTNKGRMKWFYSKEFRDEIKNNFKYEVS